MNLYGWIFLAVSWGAIILLNLYCFRRVLKEPEEEL
jgi:hypothetical protein